jgi:hypothetical protein
LPGDGEKPENEQAGWSGGFDVVLGNPPWERIKLQEKEWFASRSPEIANAPNAAARRKMISALAKEDPALYNALLEDRRKSEGDSHLVRNSGRYPLCGRGDINTYAIFAETMRLILGPTGRVGCIVPSGIATDDTTKFFFQDLMDSRSLVSLYDFENREGIFAGVHRSYKFCLLTLTGSARPATRGAEFVFFAHNTGDLLEKERRFTLSAEDIALINPNTRTCPVFRSRRDAELTKEIYRRVPVLVKEGSPEENPWGIKFATMFHMANDSHLFRTREQLEHEGWRLEGNVFIKGKELYLPLYEAKMLHHFDHRFGTYEGVSEDSASTHLPSLTHEQYNNPSFYILPRYWVKEEEVLIKVSKVTNVIKEAFATRDERLCFQALYYWIAGYRLNRNKEVDFPGKLLKSIPELFSDWLIAQKIEMDYPLTKEDMKIIYNSGSCIDAIKKIITKRVPGWLLGWRDITNTTNERTVIASILPLAAVGNNAPLMVFNNIEANIIVMLVTNLSCFCLDFISRFKVGGTHLNFFIINQLPILPPKTYKQPAAWSIDINLHDWIYLKAIELIYTSWDLEDFAKDCGYNGPPFRWDEERRFLIRCELDAAYFHLYGIERDDVDYIMETFPIVKRKDEAKYGTYRTKEVILDMYDQMKKAMDTGKPYQTMLDPPPGPPAEWPPKPGHPWPSHIHPPREEEK